MASDGENRIKVAIRVRGLSSKERERNKTLQWKLSENKLWQVDPRTDNKIGQIYTFDYVFGMDSLSHDIFEALAKPIVESCVQGFNGTIFAYGQTSSGKTYTMMGEKNEDGIIPLSINHIFKTVEKIPNREFLIRVAYMEIYNEQIQDLLEIKNNNLKIHEDASGLAYVSLKEEVADTPEKVIAVMKKGDKMRRFGATDINERSSRSHTIFRIVIESRKQQGSESAEELAWGDAVQVSMLNLVDLAGSERVMHTKATGDRLKEGCAINKSLFYLGNVISQLSDGSGQYVNFRDSKLTRILRSSLGGNAHTAIICTITPASVVETTSTLSFASRAICVKNEPHVNEIVSDECLMRRHAALVKKLELELEKARQENECSSIKKELEQKEKLISRLKDWIQRDKMLVSSPQMASRSDRRKTWAASDLEYLIRKKRYPCGASSLFTLSEELKENDFSMEIDSPSLENVFVEDGCANITLRRGSTGLASSKSSDNQLNRYSWNTLHSSTSGDQSKWGPEGSIKKRRVECELSESLQTEEIEQTRKRLEEVILRLKGTNIDLQSYSLLELVNQLTSLVEQREPAGIKSSDLPMEENEKISTLEAMLQKTKCELDSLSTEKNELESLLKIEREKYLKVDNKLKEALERLEAFSNQMQSISNTITADEKISSLKEKEKIKLLEGVIDANNVVSEYSDSENHVMQTKEGKYLMETRDVELRETMDKIALLIEENKKLENDILVKDYNKSVLLKFRENLLNLEEKLEKSEAEFVSICIGEDGVQCHISENQLGKNVELPLNDTDEKNGSTEESWLTNEVKAESLEEELYSKIDVFERLYSVAKGYSVLLKEKIGKTEVLESELKEALQKAYFYENMDSKDKEIFPEKQSSLDIVVKSENTISERNAAETILMEEQEQSPQMKNHVSKDLGEKDNLSKGLEEVIAQSKQEIEKINSQLEQERLKVSAFEISLEEKNRELEKMMLKEKELFSLIDANAAKTEDEVGTLLNRIDTINSEKYEAEERESRVKCEIVKCKEEMIELETQLQEYKTQVLALTSSNEEFQSLLSLEKQSSEEVKFQLQEALDKIAAFTKEFTEMTDKSKCNEEEFVSRLDEETDKVIRLGNELQSKIVALENLSTIVQEYKLQIDEERTNSKLMEIELKEAQAKIIALREERSSIKLLEWVEEILALKGQLEYCLLNLSSLKNEHESIKSEENNLDNIEAQLQLSLDIIEAVSGQMNVLSEKFNDNADLCNIDSEKNQFGVNLTIEGELLQNSNNELQIALNKLDAVTQNLNEVKTNEGTMSARLSEEIEKVKQLEEELEASEVVVANLVISEEEAIMELKELTRHIISLEKQLKEAQEKMTSLHEENSRIKEVVVAREEERSFISIEHAEKISRLEATIEEYKSELCKLGCSENDSEINQDNEISSMHVELEARVLELEGTLEMKQSDISRLDYEKGELETILISEKEKYQKISMELSEAIFKVDIMTKEMHESTSKYLEAEQMLTSSLSVETEKVRKLEDELESNKEVLEKLSGKVEELSALLNEERCRKAELEEEMQKRLLVLPNYISQEGSLSVGVSCNDTDALEKISLYEKKIAELEEKNESDIARLEFEKGEIEAVILSEKENESLQLSEALANLENVTKELSASSDKHKDVENQLASLILVETEKVKKLEEELETKREDMEKWHTKAEELDMLLKEEKCRKAELEVKLENIMIHSNEDTQMLSEPCTATNAKENISGRIEEMQDILEQNACDISKLVSEKKDLELQLASEKDKYQNISTRLSEALVILDNVTKALDESSAKQIEAEELSSLLNVEIQKARKLEEEIENKDKNMDNLIVKVEELSNLLNEERNVKAKLEVELEKAMASSFESIQRDSELCNAPEAIEKISRYEQKIEEIQDILKQNAYDISKLVSEKKDLEFQLTSEKDKYQNISTQLSEALVILDNVTKALDESSAKQIEAEELSSLLNVEIQKVRKLEEEIETKDKNMDNLIAKGEELNNLLNEERNVKAKLEVELEKAMSNFNESIQADGELCNANKAIEKISQYDQKIKDLEDVLERKASDVSRLVSEKKDLELLLDSEKDKYKKVSSQLSKALLILDSVTKALDESSAKQIEADELSTLLNEEIQKVKNLEGEIEAKNENLEKLMFKTDELNSLLNEEKSKKAELEVELQKALSAVPNTSCNDSILMEGESISDYKALENISADDTKTAELQEILERNASEIYRLGLERGELEAMLISEKEKNQNLTSQLSETLANLDIVSMELRDFSAKNRDEEQLQSLLNEEIPKEEKLEDELKTKEGNLGNLTIKAETAFLSGEESCKAELEKAIPGSSKDALGGDSCSENEGIEKILEYEQKIVELEGTLERNTSDIARLGFEKEELEFLLASEKVKYQNLSLQLSEALSSLEIVTMELRESSIKNRDEEQSQTRLNEEIQKVEKLEYELKTKEENLDILILKTEELATLLSEERCKKSEMEVELQKAMSVALNSKHNEELLMDAASSNERVELEKISLFEQKIAELEERSARISLERGEIENQLISEKEKNQNLSLQLMEALASLENATKELSESTEKHRDAEEQLESLLDVETGKVRKLEEELESKQEDMGKLHVRAEERISEKAAKISELEGLVEYGKKEIGNLTVRNVELESSLDSEKETSQLLGSQLKEALQKVDSLLTTIKKVSDNYKIKEEELQHNKLCLEKLAVKAEENGMQLKEERERSENLDKEIILILEDNSTLKEEKEKLIAEHKEQQASLSAHSEEIEVLKTLLEQHKSELSSLALERNSLVADLNLKREALESVQSQLANAQVEIDILSKKLIEVSNQYESNKEGESEMFLSIKAELDNAKCTLSVCAKSEEELNNLLSLEKSKVNDLHKQLSEESAKKEELITKNMELTNALLVCAKCEEELNNLLSIENNKVDDLHKQLAEESAKKEELINKNLELTDALSVCAKCEEELKNLLSIEKNKVDDLHKQLSEESAKKEELINKNMELTNALTVCAKCEEELNNLLSIENNKVDDLHKQLAEESAKKEELINKNLELTDALSVCAKCEEELKNLLSIEKNKVDDLHKQLSEESAKKEELINKNMELTNALSVCAKCEEELNNLLSIENNKVDDLHKQLAEESAKKEELINKNLELTDALSVCAKCEEELKNLLSIEKNKVDDLHKQLSEESAKEEELINKNMELTNALSVCAKCEEELNNLLSIEKNKVDDLHKQLSEESAKKEELINKNMELTNALSVCAKCEEELNNLLSIENNKVDDLLKQLAEESAKKEELINKNLELTDALSVCAKCEEELKNLLSIEKNKVDDLHKQLSEESAKKEELINKNMELTNALLVCAKCEEELNNLLSIEKNKVDDLHKKLSEESAKKEELINKNMELTNALSVCAKCEEELNNLLSIEKKKVDDLHKQLAEESAKKEELINKNMELSNAQSICTKSEEELDNLLSIEKNKVDDLHKQLAEESARKEELINKITELTNALLVCAKCEEELNNLVTIEKNKVDDLHKQLAEESAKKEELINKITELTNTLSICTKSEEELDNLLSIEKNKVDDLHKQLAEESAKKEELINKNMELTNTLSICTKSEEELDNLLSIEKNKVDDLNKQLAEESAKKEELINKITELNNTLSICTKSEEELDNLLSIEKNKVSDLNKQLSEELIKKEELVNKNLEMANSVQAIEEQLELLIEDHSKCIENESKLIAANDELSADLKGLQAKLNASTSEKEKLEAALDVKEGDISSMVKRNEELSSLVELSDRKIRELEVFIEEVNKELSFKVCEANNGKIKISELESDLKDALHKIESLSTELQQAGTNKEIEDSLKSQLSQLQVALQEANDNIKMLKEAREIELENERSNNKNIVSSLQDQISAAKEELKLNEGKISSLENIFKAETEKCALKAEEIASLQSSRNEIAELLTSEKDRVSILEKQIAKEEEKSGILEEKLEHVKAEVEAHVKNNYRLKSMETDLLSKLELEKKKAVIAESELSEVKIALSSSQSDLNELRSQINSLETRLQGDVSMITQLKTQLEIEKEAHSTAREAEKRILGVLAAQEKALSVLRSTKDDTSTEVKTLNDTIQEKEKQLKELVEKLEDQENYVKGMEQMVEKLERRNNIVLDHRIEIQNKAKEREDTLVKEISELRKKMDEVSKSGYGKCDVNKLEKELNGERLKKEEVENKLQAALSEVKNCNSQVEEYKKEILRCKQLLLGGVTRQETIKQGKFIECGVQTIPMASPEVQDIRPDGSGVVQYYKIDLLEQKVKKLEEDKDFLKKLCRRRHDQREELKLKLEALTNKGQTVQEPENKENTKFNINK